MTGARERPRDPAAREEGGAAHGSSPAAARESGPLAALQRTAGNRAVAALLRPRGGGGAPAPGFHPAAEREADRIAAEVAGSAPRGGTGGGAFHVGRRAAAALRAPEGGAPVAAGVRAPVEARLGVDLSGVRVHATPRARRVADGLGARALAYGPDIWLGSGARTGDRTLLAHELVHTVQQGAVPGGRPAYAVQRQEETPPTRRRVVVIGSPGPGDIRAGNPYQFLFAAVSLGVDANTVWLVERTGYETGEVDTSVVTRLAGPATLHWITPRSTLVDHLNGMRAGSIGSFHVFSHGLPGQVTLRYGWADRQLPNYGLSMDEIASLREDLFAADATIRFDSCNTGTSDWHTSEGNLAQRFADRTGRPVNAWTGRTSYRETNRASGSRPAEVQPSVIRRRFSVDTTEIVSQYVLDRTPTLRSFTPPTGTRVGGFTSTLRLRARLPESRRFDVPAGGTVVVRCDAPELLDREGERASADASVGGWRFQVSLRRDVSWGRDESHGTRDFHIGRGPQRDTWSGLPAGSYYLEVWRFGNSNFTFSSDITVDVHAAP